MKLGIIFKDKSKVEFESKYLAIIDNSMSSIIIHNHGSSNIHKEEPFFEVIQKKDIQLLYLGGWK